MARRTRTQRLNIYLNARFVGRLEKADEAGDPD